MAKNAQAAAQTTLPWALPFEAAAARTISADVRHSELLDLPEELLVQAVGDD